MTYRELFGDTKPVIGMLHLKGDQRRSMLDRAQEEARIYMEAGVDALLVENYFGSAGDCEQVLAWLQKEHPEQIYGVNILGDYPAAFAMSRQYGAKLIQIDSVCGHLPPPKDDAYARELEGLRKECPAVVLGGVRFKYQSVRSGRTLAEDLRLGAERCDAIVVTGDGTGMATPQEKMAEFRSLLGDFPLVVGAGVTMDNLDDTFYYGDGAIIGSWFKAGHRAENDVSPAFVQELMAKKRALGQ